MTQENGNPLPELEELEAERTRSGNDSVEDTAKKTNLFVRSIKWIAGGGLLLVFVAVVIILVNWPEKAQPQATDASAQFAQSVQDRYAELIGSEASLEFMGSVADLPEVLFEMANESQSFLLSLDGETQVLSGEILASLQDGVDLGQWLQANLAFFDQRVAPDWDAYRLTGDQGSSVFAVAADGSDATGQILELSRVVQKNDTTPNQFEECSDWFVITRNYFGKEPRDKIAVCGKYRCIGERMQACSAVEYLAESTAFSSVVVTPQPPHEGLVTPEECRIRSYWKAEYFVGQIDLQFITNEIGRTLSDTVVTRTMCDGAITIGK